MYGITKSILGVESAIYKFSAERFQSTHPCKSSKGKLEASSCWVQKKSFIFFTGRLSRETEKKKLQIKKNPSSGFVYLQDYSITQRCG